MKIVVLDDYENALPKFADWSKIQAQADVVFYQEKLTGQALIHALVDADVIVLMRDRTPFKADLIAQLPKLKYVLFTGTRNTQLDLEALQAKNIPVSCTEFGPSKETTTELTWALILSALKRVSEQSQLLQGHEWRNENSVLPALYGQRMGMLGLGEIGGRVAKVAQAFGMEVVTWSPHMTAERAQAKGATFVSLEELLQTSKVVSLHLVPAGPTKGLMNAQRLAMMRPDSVLVNTSRSSLIVTADLIAALKAGKPGQAALDVFDDEPLPKNDALRDAPNTLLTPHLGFVAQPVFQRFASGLVECLEAWLAGKPLVRPVES